MTTELGKLYRIWSGDNNDRQECYRVKALNIDEVSEWILNPNNNEILNHKDFNNDQLFNEIDYADIDLTYILLNNCLECENYNIKKGKPRKTSKCEYCEINSYIEISIFDDPDQSDFGFKVIYPFGQDNYIDLTQGE